MIKVIKPDYSKRSVVWTHDGCAAVCSHTYASFVLLQELSSFAVAREQEETLLEVRAAPFKQRAWMSGMNLPCCITVHGHSSVPTAAVQMLHLCVLQLNHQLQPAHDQRLLQPLLSPLGPFSQLDEGLHGSHKKYPSAAGQAHSVKPLWPNTVSGYMRHDICGKPTAPQETSIIAQSTDLQAVLRAVDCAGPAAGVFTCRTVLSRPLVPDQYNSASYELPSTSQR